MSTYTPRPGDVGLTSISGRVGRLIRFGQWLNGDGWHGYQHAFVVVDGLEDVHTAFAEQDGVGLVEAMPGGAVLDRLDSYNGYDVAYLRCPDEYRQAVAAAAKGLLGTPYSFADYLSLALRRMHIPAPHLRAYIRSSGHLICSQLCDRAAEMGGWHLWDDGRWEGDVTPGDLYQLYREQQSRVTP